MTIKYKLIECPNCHYKLENYRYCQNCNYQLVSDEDYENSQIELNDEIRKQSLEINICNCENCCVHTPLFENQLFIRDAQVKRNKIRIMKYEIEKLNNKILEIEKKENDYEIYQRTITG